MKICFFADGESIHTLRWCQYFVDRKVEVHLITFKQVQVPGVQVHFIDGGTVNVSGGNGRLLLKYRRVKKILRSIRPDIFHAFYATSYGITGALCAYHPYLISAWGSDVLVSPNQSKLIRILMKLAFRRADWITVVADHMQSAVVQLGGSSERLSTVSYGVNPSLFNRDSRQLDPNRFVITSTRNLEPVYNIPQLIRAVALVRDSIPGLKLNLIGSGSLREELEQMVQELHLESCVIFHGKLTPQNLVTELKHSDVFVTVSRSDGEAISLVEAMACGVFCIASDIVANQQWIRHNENGFLVKLDDVEQLAAQLIECSENYETLQQKALVINEQIVEERGNWFNNMKKITDLYQQLLKQQ